MRIFLWFFRLIRYNVGVALLLLVSSCIFGPPLAIEARPPSKRSSVFSPAPGAGTSRLEMRPRERKHVRWVDKSSPRLAARDGMEQGPYEFPTHALALAFGAKGLGDARRSPHSAFPRFKEIRMGS
jgi:hypothetical protein